MAKKMTLCEQANHAAERMWPDLNERDGIRRKSVQLWLAGHRANRLTRAERAKLRHVDALVSSGDAVLVAFAEGVSWTPEQRRAYRKLAAAISAATGAKGGAR